MKKALVLLLMSSSIFCSYNSPKRINVVIGRDLSGQFGLAVPIGLGLLSGTFVKFINSKINLPDWALIGSSVLTSIGSGCLVYYASKRKEFFIGSPKFAIGGAIVSSAIFSYVIIHKLTTFGKYRQIKGAINRALTNKILHKDFVTADDIINLCDADCQTYPLAYCFDVLAILISDLKDALDSCDAISEQYSSECEKCDNFKNRIITLINCAKEAKQIIQSVEGFNEQNNFYLQQKSIEEQQRVQKEVRQASFSAALCRM